MDVSWILSKGITLALEFRAFILKYGEMLASKERFLNAISDQALVIDKTWNKMDKLSDSVIELVDSIKDYPTINQLNDFLIYTADAMKIYSDFINAYIEYSVVVKQFSKNKYLMENLKNYKGILYDYVERVSETVLDDNTLLIGGNFYTFLKACEKDLIKKPNKKESEKIIKQTKIFIDKIKIKILPYILQRKPRIVFKPKRIELIYKEPYKNLIKDQEKIKIDIPKRDMLDLMSKTPIPIFQIFDELSALENKVKKARKLTRALN